MGKRAAAKPKPQGGPKRARGGGPVGPPIVPPDAPEKWARPALDDAWHETHSRSPLQFFLLDVEDFAPGAPAATDAGASAPVSGQELRLHGVSVEGHSVCARLPDFHPYFYAQVKEDQRGFETDIRAALDAALPSGVKVAGTNVISIEVVRRTPVMVYQDEVDLLRVTVASHKMISHCVRLLESGLRVPTTTGANNLIEVQCTGTFENNVSAVLRFLVDKDLGGGRWVELPAGRYRSVPSGSERVSTAQIEVQASASTLAAVPLENEIGSSLPPIRKVALQGSTNPNGDFDTAACTVTIEGESEPIARAIWMLRDAANSPAPLAGAGSGGAAGEWADITFEEYDPSKPEPAKVFVSNDEDTLLEHMGRTLKLLDGDLLVAYDVQSVFRSLLGRRGFAKAGSPMALGLGRRLAAEVKMTKNSGEMSGLVGRLCFDVFKLVEKEHKLVEYSLSTMLEHFCKAPLPEFREAALAQMRASRPRALAQHALNQASASVQVFDHLALFYNYVEMARVTGCPFTYLLERGQAVKVQAQLLREAQKRGFVVPAQRPGGSEESTFEGATVLPPNSGFYRTPVAVLDFASLYPSIMLAHNLCYSTLLPGGAEKAPQAPAHKAAPAGGPDDGLAARAVCCFVDSSVRRGLLPLILEQLLAARKSAKKELAECGPGQAMRKKILNGRQLALKLSANSVYGFTGALNGPLPCLEVAGAVTAYGRDMIQQTKQTVESHFSTANGYKHDAEVIYGDTDSVMVKFGPEGEIDLPRAMELSKEAAEVCSAVFAKPVKLEFEKVYMPYLLMNKKRYAGLAWTSVGGKAEMETKGIETVRRDWSDLVRQGMEKTLQLLLRPDGADGSQEAIAFVRSLVDDLRQNKIDLRALAISKSIGKEEYAHKTPHSALVEKMKQRDPTNVPSCGDRVSYLVLAGSAKAKVYERVEDPLYALENELPIDAEYYLDHQLKQPLLRIFDHVIGDKAEQLLFGVAAGQQKIVVSASAGSARGLGKFMKPRPKCLCCFSATVESEKAPFCAACKGLAPERHEEVKQSLIVKGRALRSQHSELRASCASRCVAPSGKFDELPCDFPPTPSTAGDQKEVCHNSNCQVIFRRAKVAKELKAALEGLSRFGVADV